MHTYERVLKMILACIVHMGGFFFLLVSLACDISGVRTYPPLAIGNRFAVLHLHRYPINICTSWSKGPSIYDGRPQSHHLSTTNQITQPNTHPLLCPLILTAATDPLNPQMHSNSSLFVCSLQTPSSSPSVSHSPYPWTRSMLTVK